MANISPTSPTSPPQTLVGWGKRLASIGVALWGLTGVASAQDLVIESWRKDDQILWDKVLIPAFQKLHPGIRLKFKPEEPLAYDGQLEARLATRRAGDLIFCRPFDENVRMQVKGYFLPIKEHELTNFSQKARMAWTSDDGKTTHCMPVAYVIHGLFYNQKIFGELNLKAPVTVDELLTLLGQVSAHSANSVNQGKNPITPLALGTADMWEANQVVFTGMGPNFWEGEKARQGLMKRTAKFTDPGFIKAWQLMAQFKPYMHAQQNEMSNSDVQLLFATGHAAVYPQGPGTLTFCAAPASLTKNPLNWVSSSPRSKNADRLVIFRFTQTLASGSTATAPTKQPP